MLSSKHFIRNVGLLFAIASLFILILTLTKDRNEYDLNEIQIESLREEEIPCIYVITPTYPRAEQLPELTRLGQTLLHVKKLIWIVVEDAASPSADILAFLERSGLDTVYLRAQMPDKYKTMKLKPKGVANRNAGIDWVRQHAVNGVVYLADDDNTYDLRIFEDIRQTRKVSMFPMGLIPAGLGGVDTPIVKEGKVVGFYATWVGGRTYPVDMAQFAISVRLLLKFPHASMPYTPAFEEDGFLKALHVDLSDIEPKAVNCTKVWVWHTQTKKNKPVDMKKFQLDSKFDDSNMAEIKKLIWTVET